MSTDLHTFGPLKSARLPSCIIWASGYLYIHAYNHGIFLFNVNFHKTYLCL